MGLNNPGGKPMLIQCCVCKKIEIRGRWSPADGIIYDASHTYCPTCAEDALDEIQAFKQARLRVAASGPGRLRALVNPPAPWDFFRTGAKSKS